MRRRPDAPLAASGWMLLAGLAFTGLDGISKQLAAAYPALQIVWLRYLLHVVLLLAVMRLGGRMALLRTRRLPLHLVRGALVVSASLLLYLSVRAQPLSLVYAIAFITPLEVAALAAWLLRERVGPWAWAVIAVGFSGVLLIVQPGSATWTAAVLLPVLMATLNAGYQVLTRHMGATEHPYTAQVYPGLVGIVALALPALAAWTPLAPLDLVLVVVMSALGLLGQLSLTEAFTRGQAAHVAPLVYVQLLWASAVDWLVFGVLPGPSTWAGAALIVASGLVLAGMHWRTTRARIGARPPIEP